jgi:flagellar assembly factor FliW
MSATTFESLPLRDPGDPPQALSEPPPLLIALGAWRDPLRDRTPGTGFLWQRSLEDPSRALPVIDPRSFFAPFALQLSAEDRERVGAEDPGAAQLYVTVRTAPDPADIVANLRAPLVVWQGYGHQVLNTAPGAELRVALFAPVDPTPERARSQAGQPVVDAA